MKKKTEGESKMHGTVFLSEMSRKAEPSARGSADIQGGALFGSGIRESLLPAA
jgi:hypothetical protein